MPQLTYCDVSSQKGIEHIQPLSLFKFSEKSFLYIKTATGALSLTNGKHYLNSEFKTQRFVNLGVITLNQDNKGETKYL